jgi:hypothetical protein
MKTTITLLATTFIMLIPSGCVERDAPQSSPGASPEQISAAMAAPNAKAAIVQVDSSRVAHAAEPTNKQVVRAAGEYWAEHPDDYAGRPCD